MEPVSMCVCDAMGGEHHMRKTCGGYPPLFRFVGNGHETVPVRFNTDDAFDYTLPACERGETQENIDGMIRALPFTHPVRAVTGIRGSLTFMFSRMFVCVACGDWSLTSGICLSCEFAENINETRL